MRCGVLQQYALHRPHARDQRRVHTYRLALWALKVRHLLALRLCQVDALWVVPAFQ